jgi:GTP-binding protein HflX
LVASFRATLEEARQADLLLHVVDASHAQWEEQAGVVLDVLEDLGLGGRRIVHVLHKLDRVPEPEPLLARAVERWGEVVGTSVVPPQRGLESLRALMARDAYTMDGGRARDVRARVASEGRSKWSRVR